MTVTRSGSAALIGRPNAGKSTLINQLLGERLAITSSKPQTTRDRILGVRTDERMQLVLLDTPGIHKAWTALNKVMVGKAEAAIHEADVVCWLEDMASVRRRVREGEPPLDAAADAILTLLEASNRPVILVANKMDIVQPEVFLPFVDAVRERLPKLHSAVPASALTGMGVPDLLEAVFGLLPEGPALYPEEHWTDATERFLVAEIIREKVFHLTAQEVPYATYVEIETFDESERELPGDEAIVRIHAAIAVERPQQKGILIGRGGDMIKRIGTLARTDIQELLGCRVYLELFVKVEPDWSKSPGGVRKAGYKG